MKIKCKKCQARTIHSTKEKILPRPRVSFHLGKRLTTKSVFEFTCTICQHVHGKKIKEEFSSLTPS